MLRTGRIGALTRRRSGRPGRPGEPAGPQDAGFALMMVLITMMALMLFMTISVAAVVQNAKPARAQEDAKAATAAAQAGIEEYIGRLQNDSEYWRRDNVDATNAAFSATGRLIPGLTTGASYRYQVLNSVTSIDAGNPIQLRVTGISSAGNGGRTITQVLRAQLQKTGTAGAWTPQYPYFSNYEVGDPNQFPSGNAKCGAYYYGAVAGTASATAGRSSVAGNATACPEIPWFTGDQVTGQVYSNDAPYSPGNPTFSVKPKTAYPGAAGKFYWGSGTPTNTPLNSAAVANLPSSNSYLLKDVNPRPDGGTPGPGCLYKGATKITFSGTSMTVYSPLTTTTTAGCFNATQATSAQTLTSIPPVIYVQSTTTGTCPLLGYPATNEFTGGTYTDSAGGTQYTPDYSCNKGTAYVSGTANGNVTVGTENDIVVGGDLTTSNTTTNMIGLNAGADVWVYHPVRANSTTTGPTVTTQTGVGSCSNSGPTTSGGTTTTVTCSSQYCNGIQIIVCLGTLVYDKQTTVTTTVATYANLLTTPVLNITASILTGNGSFLVQNFNRGAALSTVGANRLTVLGSISQKYRGPVAAMASSTYATGYLVNYSLDPRLPNQVPPYFVDPGLTTWSQTLLTDS